MALAGLRGGVGVCVSATNYFFEFISNQEVYINHEYKGLFKLKVDQDLTKAEYISQDSVVEKGLYSSLTKSKNDILYTNKKGIFKYDFVYKKVRNYTGNAQSPTLTGEYDSRMPVAVVR